MPAVVVDDWMRMIMHLLALELFSISPLNRSTSSTSTNALVSLIVARRFINSH